MNDKPTTACGQNGRVAAWWSRLRLTELEIGGSRFAETLRAIADALNLRPSGLPQLIRIKSDSTVPLRDFPRERDGIAFGPIPVGSRRAVQPRLPRAPSRRVPDNL